MRRLVAEVSARTEIPVFYCLREADEIERSVSWTLLDLLAESWPPDDDQLEALISRAELGRYVPAAPSLPDWSINDKNVWLTPPMAELGCICVSNENAGDFSVSDGGRPQQFTYEQFRAALKHWREFRELMAREGKANLVGRRYEAVFPE
jgi:hypothetical protein